MDSIWKQTVQLTERETLKGDKTVENLVIGAGMAGILIAYMLKEKGREVVVIEANRIAGGQTGNTTAKITAQHGLIYDKLIHKVSAEEAEQYAKANQDAIRMYEKIVQEEDIECHMEQLPSFLYTTTEEGAEELRREAQAAKQLGVDARYVKGSRVTGLPFAVKAAVRFADQAQFHPLEFLAALVKKLEIYEHTKALEVKEHRVITNHGTITAQNIIFATHYPFVNFPGFYFLREHQERSYVLALKLPEKMQVEGMYYSVDEKGLSLRTFGDMLLLGGGSHRTGKSVDFYEVSCKEQSIQQGKGYAYLREMAGKYYPEAEECAFWAAQDCMTHDEIPFIGKYSLWKPYWYVATGFHKWGMTSSMIAAMEISSEIANGKNMYGRAFSPQRFLVQAGIKNFFVDLAESVRGLWKGFFGNKEHRCPHLGCELKWNEEEQSWDCPCHGSRFTKEGELLDNPAQVDLKGLMGEENSKPH